MESLGNDRKKRRLCAFGCHDVLCFHGRSLSCAPCMDETLSIKYKRAGYCCGNVDGGMLVNILCEILYQCKGLLFDSGPALRLVHMLDEKGPWKSTCLTP